MDSRHASFMGLLNISVLEVAGQRLEKQAGTEVLGVGAYCVRHDFLIFNSGHFNHWLDVNLPS